MKENKWFEEPMTILDFIPPAVDKYEKMDIQEDYRVKEDLGFNAEHLEVHDISVGESGIAYYPSEYAVECRKNILQEIMDTYDTDVIKPIVYVNVHWLAEMLVNLHNDWAQRDIHGNIITAGYGTGGYSCVNSPFREYSFGAIRTLAHYNIKGIFLDGPIVHEKGCFCSHCKNAFMEMYGYSIDNVPDGRNTERDWFEFKRRSIANFMKEARNTLKSIKSDAIIYMNSPQLASTKLCSRDTRMTAEFQDMLLAEGGFLNGDLRKLNIWKPAATAMLLEEQAEGKPYCVAISGRLAPWSKYLLSASEIRITYAMSIANGAWIWFGIYNENKYNKVLQSVKELNSYTEKNKKWLMNTRSSAKIALLWSYPTANYYDSSADETDFTEKKTKNTNNIKGDCKASFDGWFEAMSRTQNMFDIIDNKSLLEGKLDKYELLILPETSCMSDEEIGIIEKYVKDGGNLIFSFDTSLYNEFGVRRNDFGLKDLIGMDELMSIETFTYDHIKLDLKGSGLTADIDQDLLPAAKLGVKFTTKNKSDVMAYYREKQVSRYSDLPDMSNNPYVIFKENGRGKVIYFSGNIGGFYNEFRLKEYEKLIENSIGLLSPKTLKVKAESDINSLHVTLRKQDDNMILHVVNYTGAMTRPIQNVMTLRNVQIEIYNIESANVMVESLVNENNAICKLQGNTLSIVLKQIKEYEAVAIKLN